MTVAFERRRALEWAGETLREIRMESKDMELWGGPVPEKLREMATRILRHYPEPWQIEAATEMEDEAVCDWISKDFQDRIIIQYDIGKTNRGLYPD